MSDNTEPTIRYTCLGCDRLSRIDDAPVCDLGYGWRVYLESAPLCGTSCPRLLQNSKRRRLVSVEWSPRWPELGVTVFADLPAPVSIGICVYLGPLVFQVGWLWV